MKLPKTVGVYLFFFLNIYSVTVIFISVFLIREGVELFFYLKSGIANFDLKGDFLYSIKSGLAAGFPAGTGIWILSKLQEKQGKAAPPDDSQ